MALLAICLACSTFMFFVLLFGESWLPAQQAEGATTRKGRTEAKRLVCSGRSGPRERVPRLSVARVAVVETEGVSSYTPGRGNFIAAKRRKRTNSSARRASFESASEMRS